MLSCTESQDLKRFIRDLEERHDAYYRDILLDGQGPKEMGLFHSGHHVVAWCSLLSGHS
jgi:hypothetical protein